MPGFIFALADRAMYSYVHEYTKKQDRLLFDSGAAVHVCPLDYATEYPLCTTGSKPALRTVTGEAITVHGTRTVHYQMDARSAITINYVVADVSMPVLAVSRLLRLGYVTVLTKGDSYLQPGGTSYKWPVWVDGSRFYLCPLRRTPPGNRTLYISHISQRKVRLLETGRGDFDTSTRQTTHGGSYHPQG